MYRHILCDFVFLIVIFLTKEFMKCFQFPKVSPILMAYSPTLLLLISKNESYGY